MNEFLPYEFVVRQKIKGRYLFYRIALIFLYVAFVLAWLVFGLRTRIFVPLLALIPISLWVLIFITWRYVSVEYECSIVSGVLTFAKIYGNRSRRRVVEITLRDAVRIAPLDNGEESARADAYHPEREFSAVSSFEAPAIYYILFEHNDKRNREKRRAIFYFEPTEKALSICRHYNPGGTVRPPKKG